MFKKTLTAACLAAALVAPAAVQAFTINAGPYKMTVDGYTNGTLYPVGVCATVGACDILAQNSVGSPGSEDSWGILSISSITNTVTNTTMFSRGADGYLIGNVTGITDFNVLSAGFLQSEYSTGGKIRLYTSATDYDPNAPSNGQAAILAAQALNPLYLELDFVTGVDATPNGLVASYTGVFAPAVVAGSGYLSVVAGSAMTTYDTNGLTTTAGLSADAFFNTSGQATPTSNTGCNPNFPELYQQCNWLVVSTSGVTGTALPEPGSLALLAGALFGMAGLRRRTKASN